MAACGPDMKILYVDDDLDDIEQMRCLFRTRPALNLATAICGEEGYKVALKHLPDFLLLALDLPDCHGDQLLEKIRAHRELRDTPAAALAHKLEMSSDSSFMETWLKPLNVKRASARLDLPHARSVLCFPTERPLIRAK